MSFTSSSLFLDELPSILLDMYSFATSDSWLNFSLVKPKLDISSALNLLAKLILLFLKLESDTLSKVTISSIGYFSDFLNNQHIKTTMPLSESSSV